MIYTIKAFWPNSTVDPLVKRCAHIADALECALSLRATLKHTTIDVLTPDALSLIRLWGQPMPNGQDWP